MTGETMSRSNWEEVQEDVQKALEDGKKTSDPQVEILSRMVWQERQKNDTLCRILKEIQDKTHEAIKQ